MLLTMWRRKMGRMYLWTIAALGSLMLVSSPVLHGQGALPKCSGTLPRSLECTTPKTCAAPVEETCATFIRNLQPVLRCSSLGATEGDHCVTTSTRVACARKGLCEMKLRPNKPAECVEGVAFGSVWRFVAVLGGDCFVGPAG